MTPAVTVTFTPAAVLAGWAEDDDLTAEGTTPGGQVVVRLSGRLARDVRLTALAGHDAVVRLAGTPSATILSPAPPREDTTT